jgi:hypothetical protein
MLDFDRAYAAELFSSHEIRRLGEPAVYNFADIVTVMIFSASDPSGFCQMALNANPIPFATTRIFSTSSWPSRGIPSRARCMPATYGSG